MAEPGEDFERLTLPFTFSFLGLGLYISTQVDTREAAGQMAMGTILPAVFLSGYVFPLDSMPKFFQWLSNATGTDAAAYRTALRQKARAIATKRR